jgi:hypothetical protein
MILIALPDEIDAVEAAETDVGNQGIMSSTTTALGGVVWSHR